MRLSQHRIERKLKSHIIESESQMHHDAGCVQGWQSVFSSEAVIFLNGLAR